MKYRLKKSRLNSSRIIEKTEEEKSVEWILAKREMMVEKACKYQKFIDSLSRSDQNIKDFLKVHTIYFKSIGLPD